MLYNLPNAVSESDSARPVGLRLLDKRAAIHLRSAMNHVELIEGSMGNTTMIFSSLDTQVFIHKYDRLPNKRNVGESYATDKSWIAE